ncbi:hypothetical protein F66182_9694 [Fusarium sp. NRRL 66182]|nr:hypothetical protein F66182_9694 [Fusarium sp. NRRL 66182]
MLILIMILTVLVPFTLAASAKRATCRPNKLSASVTIAHANPNNKNDIAFRLYTDGISTRCPPLARNAAGNTAQVLVSGKVYECANPDATFSYNGQDGKIDIWVANGSGKFGGSAIVSPLSPEVISINLECQNS